MKISWKWQIVAFSSTFLISLVTQLLNFKSSGNQLIMQNYDIKECNTSSVPAEYQCAYIKTHCSDQRKFGNAILPYFTLKKCSFGKLSWLFVILSIIYMNFPLLILQITLNFSFINSLSFIADALHIPDSITGLFLVAFGIEGPSLYINIINLSRNYY